MKKNAGEPIKKSRYGRISTKRQFNEEFDNSSGGSSKAVVTTSNKRNKSKLPAPSMSNSINSVPYNDKVNNYTLGDIVWAKPGKYPIWPGIVISDPESKIHYKSENNFSFLHIYYFNDAYKRNWIRLNQIFKFDGKVRILVEFPKLEAHITRSKIKQKWNLAVDQAECLAKMDREDRLNVFFSNNILTNTEMMNNAKDNMSSNKQTKKDQQQSTVDKLSTIYNKKPKTENQPSTSCVVQITTEVLNDDFNPNVANHKTQINNLSKEYPKEHPRILIPELCKLFYLNGWVTGTGGGISIKLGNNIYIAPSGVQKERITSEDLFVQDIRGVDIELPCPKKNLSKSQCTPIFMCSYTMRGAGAVIHIHSLNVVKLCLLNPGKELRIQDIEIIKGIYNEEKQRYYDNDEEVIIPIIENAKYERDLVGTFKIALKKYPMTSAILVRNHGMYVWGKDWKSAKTQCECYDYAFNVLVFKKANNL